MAQAKRPRGTRDFGPAEMAARRAAEATMRDSMRRYGYNEVQTPTFEELALFTAKSGEGIIDELYAFKDKADRDLALRPELTAAVMRFYYESLTVEPKPLKLFYFGNCFRYDRPQKGRYREFWQMGCELIGPDHPEAVGEVLALGAETLRNVGVQDLIVRVGHIDILQGALRAIGHPEAGGRGPIMRLIDKWDETAVRAAFATSGVSEADTEWFISLRTAQTLEALNDRLDKAPGDRTALTAAFRQLSETVGAAIAFGLDDAAVVVDPLIARGLDYYTGVVFEMDAPALGAEKQLLGGGSYDLAAVFDGEPVATCGFGLGFDRTLVALDAEGRPPAAPRPVEVYVAPIGDAPRRRAMELATEFRAMGAAVEVDLMRRNPGKNLKAAATRNARYAVLIGEKELEAESVTVKDLISGEQETFPFGLVVPALAARLGHTE